MKAINLFAGIGTMTRAFLAQGAEVIWAQEEIETAAEVYQYNFPEISFFGGALENGIEQIPEHDLLLASIRCVPFSVSSSSVAKYSRGEKEFEEKSRTGKHLELLRKVVKKYRPVATCIMLPVAALRGTEPIVREVQKIFSEGTYYSRWGLMSGTEHGQVPFLGRKCYLIAFRDEGMYSKFVFPKADQIYAPLRALPQWHVKKDERYYIIPDCYKELLRCEKFETGKIYSVLSGYRGREKNKILKEYDSCPILTRRSWYRTFVMDENGVRKITPEEYMSIQGDKETEFPPEMSHSKIWDAMSYAGIYGIEEKIAFDMRQILEGDSLPENIAGYLLREFDDEKFFYRKKAGMVCMPVGTGYTKTIKFLVQGIIKRTDGKWKIIVLETSRMMCSQIEQTLQDSGFTVRTSVSLEDTNNFLSDRTEILIVTYARWENYIQNFKPKGVHVNLIVLGAHAESGWRCLVGTEKYLPQVIYAGVASIPNLEAIEVFGRIRYQYTLKQAYNDHLMNPVTIDYWDVPLTSENNSGGYSILVDKIWEDMLLHAEKTLIIAETISQAQFLQQSLLQLLTETQENWKICLCVSEQEARDREEQINAFRNSYRSVLITVAMWRNLQMPDVSQIYVLRRVGRNELVEILSLASTKYQGKETVRVVIRDQEMLEKAQVLTNTGEDNKELASFCTHLWKGEYAEAATDYEQISVSSTKLAEQLKKELEVCRDRIPVSEMGQIDKKQCQRMIKLWLFMSKLAMHWEKSQDWKGKVSVLEGEQTDQSQQEEEKAENEEGKLPTGDEMSVFTNAAEKGAVLENALLRLLSCLFTWNREDNPNLEEKAEAVLHFLQKRPSGDQNGRDLDLVYLDETGEKRRCYFECKFIQSKKLTDEMILAKILQAQRHEKGEIEHWILVAPTARLSKHVVDLFEDAERMPGKYYPIKNIQIWSEENCIRELLGIEPELYAIFYGKQSDKESDSDKWSIEKKNEIVRKWKRKLMPVIMLPKGLHLYPSQSEKIMFELQNDVSARVQYELLFQYRVKMSFYKDNQETQQISLEEDMEYWLFSESCRIRLLLGEFASGKTFFLYCLCRKLLAEFANNPQKNYIPICISLKNLREADTPFELIERRMKELGCNYEDFYNMKEKFHVLVCLDGFDEITSVVDDKTIGKNIRLLATCCEHLTGAKILITSRPQCFEKNDVKKWLSERMGGVEILHMAPVGQEAGEQFVLHGIEDEERMERWEQLLGNRNIRALMEKPFFLDMIRMLLKSGEKIGENAVSVYEHYIRECLKRKFDHSFDREDVALLDKGETIDRIYHSLCSMAYKLQSQGEETVRVSEFETYLGESAAKVLWMQERAGEEAGQDADNRFSMRTLLKYADESGDRVEFSHRSIREYFVAVYLWNLLKDDNPNFKEELWKNYYSHETLGFLAELIQGEPSKREKSMYKLIELMEQDIVQSNLSAKIMQILYFANEDRKIPKANWSKKNLSDISIPGADLSDQNLRGAIFTNANLNNVHLDGCDCSYCDMTGARLGESGKILSLRYASGELMCLYEDGCMRGWDIQCIEESSYISDIPVMEHAVLGENGLLCLQNDMKMRMIQFQGNSWYVSQEYVKRNNRRLLSMSGELLLLREVGVEGTKLILIHMQTGSVLKEWMADESSCGTIANGNLVVIYDGAKTIELFYINDHKRCETFDVEKCGNVIALDAYLKNEAVYVLLGYSDGAIWVYQYKDGMLRSKMESKLYGLMHLAFCGSDVAAIADSEGGIHQALLDYNKRQIHMDWKATMKLSIYCKNIKTDGLIPESIRLRLLDRS